MNKISFADYRKPSRFLKASDLIGRAPLDAEIVDFHDERMGRDKDLKLCVNFRGLPKPMVLNQTAMDTIEKCFGDPNASIGKKVTLLVLENQEYNGELHDVIRISSKLPKPSLEEELGESGENGGKNNPF